MAVIYSRGENGPARAAQSGRSERSTNMKTVEEMNAMEVCAYLVAKASRKEIGEDEIRRLYDVHCAKLKKELAERRVGEVSEDFRKELAGSAATA